MTIDEITHKVYLCTIGKYAGDPHENIKAELQSYANSERKYLQSYSPELFSVCCGTNFTQKMFYSEGNKRRSLESDEFNRLRASEIQKNNWFDVPHVIWRFICDNCGNGCDIAELSKPQKGEK